MEATAELSEIQYFYKNTTVLLTGATGFVGKLLLEKILRLLHVKHVYILVRAKKDKDPGTRCAEIFESPLFGTLKRTNQEFQKKVSVVIGDCEKPDLGLGDQDKEMLIAEVDCVFHCAATTRLDQTLEKATKINVKATRDLLQMAKKMKNLKCFVFISTAYSNFSMYEIHEQFYEPKMSAEELIETIENMELDSLKSDISSSLMNEWPNAYTFTKQIAEDLVNREGKNMPVSVVRASMALPTMQEPVTGYVDNVFSISGLAVASALGVNRVNYYNNGTLDVVPVDLIVSQMIAAGWYSGLQKVRKQRGDINSTDVLLYHCISSQEKPLTIDEWVGATETAFKDAPTLKMIQLPMTFNTSCYYNYKFLTFILHTFMGFLCDTGLQILGKRPKIVEGYRKFHKFQDEMSVYLTKQWYFSNDNSQKLLKRMSYLDRELFNFDILNLNWSTYFSGFARGLRVYVLKDPMSTISEAREKQRKKLIGQIVMVAAFIVISYVVCKFVLFRILFR